MKTASWTILLVPLLFGGCGGYYILSVPDQLASTEGSAVPVARLQRNDFFVLALAAPELPLRFRVFPPGADTQDTDLGGPLRASHTDEVGYAGVKLSMEEAPVSGKAGVYPMKVAMLDPQGEEKIRVAPLYVWDPDDPVVAVDLDSLPGGVMFPADDAVEAVRAIAGDANVVYLTRRWEPTMARFHRRLETSGFPDGPILQWQRQRWHIVHDDMLKLPRVIIESRLVSQLEDLAEQFPNLRVGVCNNALAAKAFVDLGMTCVVVGNSWLTGSKIVHRSDWSSLTENPVPVAGE